MKEDLPPSKQRTITRQEALNTFIHQCTPPDKTKKNEWTTYLAVAHALSGGQEISTFGQQKVMQAKQILRRGGFGRMRRKFAYSLRGVCTSMLDGVNFDDPEKDDKTLAEQRKQTALTLAAAIRSVEEPGNA